MYMANLSELVPSAPTAPDALIPRIAYVRRRRRDSRQVWTLELQEQGGTSASFQPGQFNMLTVFGVGEVPISLSGDPARPERLIHTVRPVGAVSTALTELRAGDVVGLRGPFGVGWPVAEMEGRDLIIIAGGLGLAPLRPVLYHLRSERKRYGRIALLYGTRSPEDLLFMRELDRWRQRAVFDVQVTVDHATGPWNGNVGVVTALVPRTGCELSRTTAFVCGPEVMMRMSAAALLDSGVAEDAIFLSMERNMKCAVAQCGRCQLGRVLVCRDGPVFRYDRIRELLACREL